ncbi:hypothetical protein [Streptomyces sp. NPDC097619]|uniref:hypothetical protein n=1 Tax=Streptomyces sp. NPDC097619 TaxID=3157228 RepID=UPI003324A649
MRRVEAVIVERYPQLVRLAYLTLADGLDRHTRVLRAHRAVQRSLGGAAREVGRGAEPTRAVRAEVVRLAARRGRLVVPPWVWGLRMWPVAEELDDTARALAGLGPFARAGFVLCRLDGLAPEEALGLLALAGAAEPEEELRAGLAVPGAAEAAGTVPAEPAEAGPGGTGTAPDGGPPGEDPPPVPTERPVFRASDVHTRPTDLLVRRARLRAGGALVAAALVLGTVLTRSGGEDTEAVAAPYAGTPAARVALDPARLVRVPAQDWSDTGRVDFTAWPARGARSGDRALLTRALATWGAPTLRTVVAVAPSVTAEPPTGSPQLLYAGDPVPGTTVVVFAHGDRIVRYTEERDGQGSTLDFARTDDANVTTAAAVVLWRDGGSVRQLLAPWIATAGVRELADPASAIVPLTPAADGTVTARIGTGAASGCADRPALPVLEVASSARIVEKHAFLLADLGGLLPVHLTYTPLAGGAGSPPARQPREATGPVARERWARELCALREVDGRAVRAVNLWDFAETDLPEGAGRALWSCTRATYWSGRGDVEVRLRAGRAPSAPVARVRSTAACGRFGQHVVAGTVWKGPSGRSYRLAAGSREVVEITVAGPGGARAAGRSLTAPAGAPGTAPPALSARLRTGTVITALDGGAGGRD